jgi:ATP-dependent Lon protease
MRLGETMVAVTQPDPEVESLCRTISTRWARDRRRTHDAHARRLDLGASQGRRRVRSLKSRRPRRASRLLPPGVSLRATKETVALMRAVLTLSRSASNSTAAFPEESYVYAMNIEEPGWLADLVTSASTRRSPNGRRFSRPSNRRCAPAGERDARRSWMCRRAGNRSTAVQSEVDRSQREMYCGSR